VGDDVVQLGGDPGALVANRQGCVRLALLLELAGPLGELLRDQLALAQGPSRPPARSRDEERRDPALVVCETHTQLDGRDQDDASDHTNDASLPATDAERLSGGEQHEPERHAERSQREQSRHRRDPGGARMGGREPERAAHHGTAEQARNAEPL
jgi:hypothetical protein